MSLPSYPPPSNFQFTAGYPHGNAVNPGPRVQHNGHAATPRSTAGGAYGYPPQPVHGYGSAVNPQGHQGSWPASYNAGSTAGWQNPQPYGQMSGQPNVSYGVSAPPLRYNPGNKASTQRRSQPAGLPFPTVPAFGATLPPFPPPNQHTFTGNPNSHNAGWTPGASHARPSDRSNRGFNGRNNSSNFNNNHKRGRESNAHHEHRPGKKIQGEKSSLPTPPSHTLPPKPPKPLATSSRSANKKKKPRNVLGLLPDEDAAPSSDDDADEEAALSANGAPQTLQSGAVSLRSQEDIQRWIAERKKKFPTRANIEAKQAATSKAETLGKAQKSVGLPSKPLLAGYESSDSDAAEAELAIKEHNSTDQPLAVRKDSKVVALDTQSNHEDEEPPTEIAIKREPVASPFGKKHEKSLDQIYCKTWARLGFCTWKKCKFLHRLPGVIDAKANEEYAQNQHAKHRRNLYQEFVKQEELEKQNIALQVVKFLGHAGQFTN